MVRIDIKAPENYHTVSLWESHFLMASRRGLYQMLSRVTCNSNLSSFLKSFPKTHRKVKRSKEGTELDK